MPLSEHLRNSQDEIFGTVDLNNVGITLVENITLTQWDLSQSLKIYM